MRSFAWGVGAWGLVSLCLVSLGNGGCQGGSPRAVRDGSGTSIGAGSSDGGGMSTAGMVSDASGSPRLCSDLFDQTLLPAYSIEITADNWAKLDADFHDLKDVLAGHATADLLPDRLPLRLGDRVRRRHSAARQILLGLHRHVRRQPEDAVRRVVRSGRRQGEIPRHLDDSPDDAPGRLDVHE